MFYGYVDDKGSGEIELYNLEEDIGESRNLAAANPDIVAELKSASKSFQWPEEMREHQISLNRK